MKNCTSSNFCSEDGIPRICYEASDFRNDVNFCDCSFWYGWTGKNCDQVGSSLVYLRVSTFIIITIFMVLLVLSTKTVIDYTKKGILVKNRPKINTAFYLAILSVITALFVISTSCNKLVFLFDSTQFKQIKQKSILFEENEDVVGKGDRISGYFLFSFQSIGSLLLVSSWMEVLNTVKYILILPKSKIDENIIFRAICIFGVLSVVFTIILSCFELFYEIIFIFFIGLLILLIAHIVGYRNFRRMSKKLEELNISSLTEAKQFIKKTSINVIISLTFGIISSMILLFLSVDVLSKEKIKVGGFNYLLVFSDFVFIAGISLSFLNWNYSNEILKRVLKTNNFQNLEKVSVMDGLTSLKLSTSSRILRVSY